jgi:hypothetical protein
MLRVARVGNPPMMNWQASMTSATFLLVLVASHKNNELTCLMGCSLHLSTV